MAGLPAAPYLLTVPTTTNHNPLRAYAGAATGAFIGDALAMPAHWYYDPRELARTFGRIETYQDPPRVHPGSILWRSRYEPTEPAYDILGSQRRYWGVRGVHYHQFLTAGENTLNLKLLALVLNQVMEHGEYSRERFINAYQSFMLSPDDHRDTYIEECHRGFFENLRRGMQPDRAAVEEKHIGGMVAVIPLYAALRAVGHDHDASAAAVQTHVAITHAGERVGDGVRTLVTLARELLDGTGLADALRHHLDRQDLAYLQGPIARLIAEPVNAVLGRRYSTACYLEESLPATFYLALKFADDARSALIENTMAGGDNCHRGAVLGALLGLRRGADAFPHEWHSGLVANVPTPV